MLPHLILPLRTLQPALPIVFTAMEGHTTEAYAYEKTTRPVTRYPSWARLLYAAAFVAELVAALFLPSFALYEHCRSSASQHVTTWQSFTLIRFIVTLPFVWFVYATIALIIATAGSFVRVSKANTIWALVAIMILPAIVAVELLEIVERSCR